MSSGLRASPVSADLWSLGQAGERAVFWALTTRVVRSLGLVELLAKLAGALPVTLVAPTSRPELLLHVKRAGFHVVEAKDAVAEGGAGVLPKFNLALLSPASPTPDLVVYVSEGKIVLNGKARKLTQQSFKLLHLLARRAKDGKPLCSRREVEKELWASSVARQAVSGRLRLLRKELAAILPSKSDPQAFIQTRQAQGLMLSVPAEKIQLVP